MSILIHSIEAPLAAKPGIRAFDRAILIAAVAALVVTAASFFARTGWMLELLTHFRMQYAIGALVLLLAAVVRRRSGAAVLAAIGVAANVAPMAAFFVPAPAAAHASSHQLRIMAANVNYRNSDYAAMLQAIHKQNPDIVGLLEVNGTWVDEMSPLRSEYPFAVLRPEEGAFGLALYSRFPVNTLQSSPYAEKGTQTAIAIEFPMQQQSVSLRLAHLMAPTTQEKAALRNAQMNRIVDMMENDRSQEQILIGDLNITPWSPYYRQFEAAANLTNAARGQGYSPTWPAGFSLFKIPIDHCLVSDGLQVRQFRRGADIGSDHLPIIVDVAFADIGVDRPN